MLRNMKKISLTLAAVLAFILLFIPAEQIKAEVNKATSKADLIVEAEKGTLTGLATKKSANVSGGAYVQGFDQSTDNLKVTVDIKVEGSYMIFIKYKTINGSKTNPVYLNNVSISNYVFGDTANFKEVLIGKYKMKPGKNTIGIGMKDGGIAIDYIRVVEQTGQVSNVIISLNTAKSLAYDNPVTITAIANDSAQYLFMVRKTGGKWRELTIYSNSSNCMWIPGEAGDYEIKVYARGSKTTVDKQAEATITYKAIEFYVGKPLVNPAYGNGMVLQRDETNAINGWDKPKKKVEVTIDHKTYTTTVNSMGEWSVDIGKHEAGGPYEITVKGSAETVKLTDILFGDVWLCSGQSNMAFTLANALNSAEEIKNSDNPNIRYIKIPDKGSSFPLNIISNTAVWKKCSASTSGDLSAIAYFFAKKLNQDLDVPIGIVFSAVGGTKAECWTSYEGLLTLPEYKDAAVAIKTGDQRISLATSPIAVYNGMISPIISYKLKGVLWYQGESNWGESSYNRLLPTLIADWRNHFNDNDLPFIIVQIPANGVLQTDSSPVLLYAGLPEVREAQLNTMLADENVGMVTIVDLGDPLDIHPKNKQDVGARAAICAEGKFYGMDIVYSGPIYKSMSIDGDKITLSFDFIGSGLMVGMKNGLEPVKEDKSGKLTGFAIAGADGVYFLAEAVISGENIIVSSSKVTDPVSVRYGWYDSPVINLYNKEGLLASPFRTDGN